MTHLSPRSYFPTEPISCGAPPTAPVRISGRRKIFGATFGSTVTLGPAMQDTPYKEMAH